VIVHLIGGPCDGATVTGIPENTQSVAFHAEIAKGISREADIHRYVRSDRGAGCIVFFEIQEDETDVH
jgi:hypothetical protein